MKWEKCVLEAKMCWCQSSEVQKAILSVFFAVAAMYVPFPAFTA